MKTWSFTSLLHFFLLTIQLAHDFPSRRAITYNNWSYSACGGSFKVSRSRHHALEVWFSDPETGTWPSIRTPIASPAGTLAKPSAEAGQKGSNFHEELNLLTHLGRRKNPLCWWINVADQLNANAVVTGTWCMGWIAGPQVRPRSWCWSCWVTMGKVFYLSGLHRPWLLWEGAG